MSESAQFVPRLRDPCRLKPASKMSALGWGYRLVRFEPTTLIPPSLGTKSALYVASWQLRCQRARSVYHFRLIRRYICPNLRVPGDLRCNKHRPSHHTRRRQHVVLRAKVGGKLHTGTPRAARPHVDSLYVVPSEWDNSGCAPQRSQNPLCRNHVISSMHQHYPSGQCRVVRT